MLLFALGYTHLDPEIRTPMYISNKGTHDPKVSFHCIEKFLYVYLKDS